MEATVTTSALANKNIISTRNRSSTGLAQVNSSVQRTGLLYYYILYIIYIIYYIPVTSGQELVYFSKPKLCKLKILTSSFCCTFIQVS